MTTLFVEDFKMGLDLRKSILTAMPGSLQTLDNCVITPGGEIQKRKAFVKVATLPTGTSGLHGSDTTNINGEQLYVVVVGGATPPPNETIATVISYIPVIKHSLQTPADYFSMEFVWGIAEYGPQQLFVSASYNTASGTPATQIGNWWLGLNVPAFAGFAPMVTGQKMYRVAGPIVYFSGVGDPSVTNPLDPAGDGPNIVNPGAGFIDTSRLDEDSYALIGMEAYYNQVAVFSRRTCILFTFDPDPALNNVVQVLRMGAVSNESIVQFGTGDVLFLNDSGVRSLRALNASLAAGVSDVGSPIDTLIQAAIAAAPGLATDVPAIVEPLSGRYWLAIGNVIYVLSYWPSAKINAWSTFTLPFSVDHMTTAGNRLFLRSGDDIYLYGGADGATYDNSVATVRTPFMAAETPTTFKKLVSVGAMVQGNWAMSLGTVTDNPSFYELVANISKDTYSQALYPAVGFCTHVSFTLTCSDAGPSLLGALAVRFAKSTEE